MTAFATLSSGDTAFALRQVLGPARNWNDFLADCNRERASHHGLILLPIARVRMPGDHCERPRYSAADIQAFIVESIRLEPPPANADALEKLEVEISPELMALPWQARHLDLRCPA